MSNEDIKYIEKGTGGVTGLNKINKLLEADAYRKASKLPCVSAMLGAKNQSLEPPYRPEA